MPGLAFSQKKAKILHDLAQPEHEYSDASPKGSIDVEIRELVDAINLFEHCVTTSSCAGRVAVFAEGSKGSKDDGSGKGDGGHWLYVSHQPTQPLQYSDVFSLLRPKPATPGEMPSSLPRQGPMQLVYFKFEPMILHIMVDSLDVAQRVLKVAVQAGFRESGVTSPLSETPMVAVRTNGIALESVVGTVSSSGTPTALVDEAYLAMLLDVSNQRFAANERRKLRFLNELQVSISAMQKDARFEDKETRKRHKQHLGRQKQLEVQRHRQDATHQEEDDLELPFDILR